MSGRLKTGIVLVFAMILLVAEAAVFWTQDWRYNLPTPKPAHLLQGAPGETLELPAELQQIRTSIPGGLVLLHFYNPDCPCSRFNLDHVQRLALQFRGRVAFVAILQTDPTDAQVGRRESRRLGFRAVMDLDGKIAAACGVYSTPQAVILDADGRLLFRGNYNLSRYCTSPATEFARLALEVGVEGRAVPQFPAAAHGCPLPTESAH
jgi:hypothetical protein